jgi:hypothetical protein
MLEMYIFFELCINDRLGDVQGYMADESLGYIVQLKGVWFTPCSAHLELFGHMYSVMLYLFDSEFGYLMVLKK